MPVSNGVANQITHKMRELGPEVVVCAGMDDALHNLNVELRAQKPENTTPDFL